MWSDLNKDNSSFFSSERVALKVASQLYNASFDSDVCFDTYIEDITRYEFCVRVAKTISRKKGEFIYI